MTEINYDAPPTIAEFMKSEAFFRLIAGPVGSGKTTGCLFEFLRRACEQTPGKDGFRHTRFAIVRQTLSQLKLTVLKDIREWLEGLVDFRVSESTIYLRFADVRSEWILVPLEDQEDQKRLLSSQLTGVWISEAIEIDTDLVPPISGRCGRYPTGKLGTCSWQGIIADTNLPSEGSEWHKLMALDTPPDWQVFIQPGGLEPKAENLCWLNQNVDTIKLPVTDLVRVARGRGYYERLARSNSQAWIKRYVHAQYGDDPSGTAVFRESFHMRFHVQDDLQPVRGHPLIVGQDFGRDPWAVITQLDHKGRLLVLEEVPAEDCGLEIALRHGLRPKLMHQRYLGLPVAIVGDPSGRSRGSIYEETSFDALKRNGFAAFPAPTNDIDPRLRSVESLLLQQRDGGPAIIFDRVRCPTLIRGMAGGYRYAKTRLGARKPLPDKNMWSHGIDALQYACLAAHGGVGGSMAAYIAQKVMGAPKVQRPKIISSAWT